MRSVVRRSARSRAGVFAALCARILLGGLALALLAGCADLPQILAPTSTQSAAPRSTPTGTLAPTSSPAPTAAPELILWLPPEFDPSTDTEAARLLSARLNDFTSAYDIPVQVRVKNAAGPGGLLDTLTTAFAAAPDAVPSVVALSRPDLEVAALKGMIYPLDGVSTSIDENDWYAYARQLATVQGATFSLPFAGDTQVLVYRPARVVAPPVDWETVYRLGQPLAFSAGDPQALFVLSLYRSMDGAVEDEQHRPSLDPRQLAPVLTALADGKERGIFPAWLADLETSAQVWEAYNDGRVNAQVTWLSRYLSDLPSDSAAVPLPPMDDTPMVLASGWGWAVAENTPAHRAPAVLLAEYLSDSEFLARWSESAGVLPTRPSALAAWQNGSLRTLLSPVAVSAQARPSVDQLASLGPVLKTATLKILQSPINPAQAAEEAAQSLSQPEAR